MIMRWLIQKYKTAINQWLLWISVWIWIIIWWAGDGWYTAACPALLLAAPWESSSTREPASTEPDKSCLPVQEQCPWDGICSWNMGQLISIKSMFLLHRDPFSSTQVVLVFKPLHSTGNARWQLKADGVACFNKGTKNYLVSDGQGALTVTKKSTFRSHKDI